MNSFVQLAEQLKHCSFTDDCLAALLNKFSQLPATTNNYLSFVLSAFERQSESHDADLADGDHYIPLPRRWRPKPQTKSIVCDFLGITDAEFARLRFDWVVANENKYINNPDYHFLSTVIDFGITRTHIKASPEFSWWEGLSSDEPDLNADTFEHPIITSLVDAFSVRNRTFTLRNYNPKKKTARRLEYQYGISKWFIYSREITLQPFCSRINEHWLPSHIPSKNKWLYLESYFSEWVIDRYKRYCKLDKKESFEYAVARYALENCLTPEEAKKNIEMALKSSGLSDE